MANASANTSLSRMLSATLKSILTDWPESCQIRCVVHILYLAAKLVVACCEDGADLSKRYDGLEKLLDNVDAPEETETLRSTKRLEDQELLPSVGASLQMPLELTIDEPVRRSQRNGKQTAARILHEEQISYGRRKSKSVEPINEPDSQPKYENAAAYFHRRVGMWH